jgi:PAS domain S-box-containing protein
MDAHSQGRAATKRFAHELGFEVLEWLGLTACSRLCWARRSADGEQVTLKVLEGEPCSPELLQRFRAEYDLFQALDIPSVPRALTFQGDGSRALMVLEDCQGELLEATLTRALPLPEALDLAERFVEALVSFHEAGFVHHDLRPVNVLVTGKDGPLCLVDLNHAASRDMPPLDDGLTGKDLAYVSPEQTGRLRHALDLRSDLYSLGVVLFRMFSGRLPFEAKDALELVHSHLARTPISLSRLVSGLPRVVADIVAKLLAKAPADRYQGARGVLNDLRRCRVRWAAAAQIEPFPLASQDSIDRVRTPQKLYGREAERLQLRAAYDRVAAGGRMEVVVISGYSGVGKSSLVEQLEPLVARDRGFFISGKFEQGRSDIPYASLAPAFRPLIQQILSGSEQQVELERRRLQGALGINGRVISELIPELELIIDKQPPVQDIGVTQAEHRLHSLFRRFIAAFATKGCPLVFFLDDLQWLDPASRKLLENLLTHNETPHLLVIGAYRDNEVSASHPLRLLLAAIEKAGTPVVNLVLAPISPAELVELVADALHGAPEDVAPLAALVYQKAAGNPFFSIQFLRSAEDDRLLEFDGKQGAFHWDVAKLHAMNLSDNVVDLMIAKLRRLPETTQEALRLLACLGHSADLSTLGIVLARSEEDVHAALWKAVVAGLIVRSDAAYRFLHDRVQEAAYALVPEHELAKTHLRIGRLLLSRLSSEQVSERLFEIVNHWHRALGLVTDETERDVLLELNFRAGIKAKAQTAYAAARSYLTESRALLPTNAWQTRYELTFGIHLELSECESLIGAYAGADELLDRLLDEARSALDRAKVSRLRIRVYQLAGRPRDAVRVLLDALATFGVTFPESDQDLEAATRVELQLVLDGLRGRSVADLVDAPAAIDPGAKAIVELLDDGLAPAYATRPALWVLLAVKAAGTSVRYGNVAEGSAFAYIALAVILVSVVKNPSLGFEFSEMSLRMNERFETTRGRLRGKLLFHHAAMVNHWCRHLSTSLAGMEAAFPACVEAGDLVCAGYLTYNAAFVLFETGAPLERLSEAAREYAVFAVQNNNDLVYRVVRGEEQFAAAMKGATRSPTCFDDGGFNERECVAALAETGFSVGLAFFYVMKQAAAFIHGEYGLALESAHSAAGVLPAATCLVPEATHHFYFALTLAALYEQATSEQQQEYRATLESQISRHQSWAAACPENFQNRHALIAAEVARIDRRPLDAEQSFAQAILSAQMHGFVHNEALAWELAARFYRGRGLDKIADFHLQRARDCYARWGATAKLRQLHAQNPRLFAGHDLVATESGGAAHQAPPVQRGQDLDLLSVMRASQAISQQIELDFLVETLMRVVLENAGAERAVLLLPRDNLLCVAAVARVDRQGVSVERRAEEAPAGSELPLSILNCVRRTRERVLLPDASRPTPFASDPYLLKARSKSILCLPILRQAEFVGVLYLENELVTEAFSADHVAVLELLAGQAAISLENARLYAELKRENSEREQAEVALRHSQALLQAVVDASTALIYVKDLQGRFLLVNRSLADLLGRDVGSVLGMSDYDLFPTEQADAFRLVDRQVIANVAALEVEETAPGPDGTHSYLSLKAPLVDASGRVYGLCGISTNITERKRAEATLLRTQEQLRQSQKMEAIGNLAGGVAHDFNNLLSVILSYSDLLAADMAPSDPRKVDLAEIQASGMRAAELTTQLLTFSRQQVLQPRIVSLNDIVVGTERLLRRLIGEDVDLTVLLAAQLGNAELDPGQVEQIVMNLAVNARDAMPEGGRLTIETANVELDQHYAAEHLGVTPGPYVMLAVTDNGCGMDQATQGRMFEPFFTTKEKGKGTGLGLATVFGIVQQSGGNVWVYSELHKGTTFKLYFPRVDAEKSPTRQLAAELRGPLVGSETILLVEDEASVRTLARTILQRAGYHVLEAQSSGDALVACEQYGPVIHLLLTDVIMPRMGGRQLSERLRAVRPAMKVLFMSGYTDNAVLHHGVLDSGAAFLQKPITPDALTRKVREVLDSAPEREH